MACWLLNRSPQHWLIFNPKWTKAYDALPDAQTIKGFDLRKINRSLERNRFTVVNPQGHETKWDIMDAVIEYYHEGFENIGLCLDELYYLHNNGRAGDGLTGWLTRGRELKQAFLGQTQRPAWISQFLFSEADYICTMTLNLLKDRKTMRDATGQDLLMTEFPERKWYWYDVGKNHLQRYGAVPPLTKAP